MMKYKEIVAKAAFKKGGKDYLDMYLADCDSNEIEFLEGINIRDKASNLILDWKTSDKYENLLDKPELDPFKHDSESLEEACGIDREGMSSKIFECITDLQSEEDKEGISYLVESLELKFSRR